MHPPPAAPTTSSSRVPGVPTFRPAFGLAVLLLMLAVPGAAAQPRNVVMIVADDQRTDTISAWGNPHIETPSLDALAARGVSFTSAYCMGSMTGAVCAPSRAMFLAGRTLFNLGPNPYDTPPEVRLLPEVLRDGGLSTFGTGKWHNGKGSFARSFDAGESVFFGGMGSHTELRVHPFDPAGEYPNEQRRRLREFSSAEFASAAVGFLESDAADQPFFLYVSFTAPHDPRTPPEADLARYAGADLPLPAEYLPVHPFDNGEMVIRDEKLAPWPRTEQVVRQQLAEYYGMITHMDRQIGRVLDAIDAAGHADDTLIVFFADHGLAVGSHGLMGKQNLYEHSTKAPLIVAGPGVERGATCDALVYLLDVPATVCDVLGVDRSWCPESQSFAPALRAEPFEGRRSVLTIYRDIQRAVRVGDWKLIRYPKICKTQLFNLADDPHELVDLAHEPRHKDVLVDLLGEMGRWQERIGDPHPLSTPEPRPDRFDHEAAETARTGG